MIEIKNLTKKFDDHIVLKNLSFKIDDNEMIAIVGKSGCGKSTLLNILGLLDSEYEGEILYNGQNLKKIKEKSKNEYIRNNINYLFQNYALIDNDTVVENLLLALEYSNKTKSEKYVLINKALEKVGLSNYEEKRIYSLSGGEQQRVALSRVILKKGNIILADEPTGNLDENNSCKVMKILKDLKKQGKTIIIVTHNDKIANECDKILEL